VGVDATAAQAAARLAKVDQGAVLVAEFSELQGYAGAHYARLAGTAEEVCQAVEEHYLPEGPDSPTPATEAGALLAVAEKVDALVGAFAINERPTSSKDPYALRRAAAGLVRIALERGWDLVPRASFAAAFDAFAGQGAELSATKDETLDALDAFVDDRLAFHLETEGVGAESARAAEATAVGGLAATARWATAIQASRDDAAFWAAWEACNRCVRVTAGSDAANGEWVTAGDAGEQALADAVATARPQIDAARGAGDYPSALAAGAALAPTVDRFFEDVMVNADDPGDRARRHALVRQTADVLRQIADFTVITQGGSR
jgi:glycyl-tRNA synthetase beta chain